MFHKHIKTHIPTANIRFMTEAVSSKECAAKFFLPVFFLIVGGSSRDGEGRFSQGFFFKFYTNKPVFKKNKYSLF